MVCFPSKYFMANGSENDVTLRLNDADSLNLSPLSIVPSRCSTARGLSEHNGCLIKTLNA